MDDEDDDSRRPSHDDDDSNRPQDANDNSNGFPEEEDPNRAPEEDYFEQHQLDWDHCIDEHEEESNHPSEEEDEETPLYDLEYARNNPDHPDQADEEAEDEEDMLLGMTHSHEIPHGDTWQEPLQAIAPPGLHFKDISLLGTWHISSAKMPGERSEARCGLDELHDGKFETYWQTDTQKPHWLTIEYNSKTEVSFLAIYSDLEADESFTPSRFEVYLGEGESHMQDSPKVATFDNPNGWEFIPLVVQANRTFSVKTWYIRLEIIDNHNDGVNSKLRHLRVLGPDHDRREPIVTFDKKRQGYVDEFDSDEDDIDKPSTPRRLNPFYGVR